MGGDVSCASARCRWTRRVVKEQWMVPVREVVRRFDDGYGERVGVTAAAAVAWLASKDENKEGDLDVNG